MPTSQKNLAKMYAGMIFVPEIIFGTGNALLFLILGAVFNVTSENFSLSLAGAIKPEYFSSHIGYAYIALVVQILGAFGLVVWSLVNKKSKIVLVMFSLIACYFVFDLYLLYSFAHIGW